MSYLEWSDRFSIGIAEIDAEHRDLVGMLNDLHAAMTEGRGLEALGDVLDRLIRYTATHFAHEEELMRRYAYPDSGTHIDQHEQLTWAAADVQARFASGQTVGLSIEVMEFLRNWLTTHIQGDDARLGAFLRNRGLR